MRVLRITAVAGAVSAVLFATPAGSTLALGAIHGYQRTLSPLAARAGIRCRFTPTCSHYAEVVIARDGLLGGGLKAAKRIARCGPWTSPGTVDEP